MQRVRLSIESVESGCSLQNIFRQPPIGRITSSFLVYTVFVRRYASLRVTEHYNMFTSKRRDDHNHEHWLPVLSWTEVAIRCSFPSPFALATYTCP